MISTQGLSGSNPSEILNPLLTRCRSGQTAKQEKNVAFICLLRRKKLNKLVVNEKHLVSLYDIIYQFSLL